MSTPSENLPKKLEDAVVGISTFGARFGRTFVAVGFRPREMARAIADKASANQFLRPGAFLLSCAITLGFLTNAFVGGIENLRLVDMIQQLKDVTLSSFLVHSVVAFLIALAGLAAVHLVMLGRASEEIRRVGELPYYVVGYFGLFSAFLLFLLSLLIPLAGYVGLGFLYTVGAAIAIAVAWVIWTFVATLRAALLLQRAADYEKSMRIPWLRIALANVLVLALCVFTFLSPLYASIPIRGSLIDLEQQADAKSVRLTYVVTNDTDMNLIINQAADHAVSAVTSRGNGVEVPGSFGSGCGLKPPKEPFVVIEPRKFAMLTTCVTEAKVLTFLKETDYGETTIDNDKKKRLLSVGRNPVKISVRLIVAMAGRNPTPREVELRQGEFSSFF